MARDAERLRLTLNQDALLYDRMRPAYPAQLSDDLVVMSGLRRGGRVLEVGCGTGQATGALAPPGLSHRLRGAWGQSCRGPRGTDFPSGAMCASSPQTSKRGIAEMRCTTWCLRRHRGIGSIPRAGTGGGAQALEPEGTLAIITTHHVLPHGGDRFFADVQDDYASIREVDSAPPLPDDVEGLVEEIGSSGWFSDVDVRRYALAQTYTTDEYLSLLDTYSGHRAMEARTRALLYRRIARRIDARSEGHVTKHFLFVVHVARRRAGVSPSSGG